MHNQVLKGISASDGVAIAKAYLLIDPDLSFSKETILDVDSEFSRLNSALEISKKELQLIKKRSLENFGSEESEVFEAHSAILSDPELIGEIVKRIQNKKINAEQALKDITDKYIYMFESMTNNAYMQERASDVHDVTRRVMAHLLGVELPNPALIDHEVVLVAHDLTPSDTAQLNKKYVKGFITDMGGQTSHSAIMSRTLGIPAVVGSNEATAKIVSDQVVIVDGLDGQGIVNPTDSTVTIYQVKQAQFLSQKAEWNKLKTVSSLTQDGVSHIIAANIGTPDDLQEVLDNGGEGVGLFRSEFLYMNTANWPTEEEQYEAYKKVVKGMNGKPVVVRTMDIGGDKNLPYLQLPDEMNPFMGYRAIRISLDKTDIFRTQLRALLRASNFGNLWIMFPMIATINELRSAKKIYEEERQIMIDAGQSIGNIDIGMMLEIPSAAVLADQFAKEVDFMSIGTNDLIGYSMAADRTNEKVSYLYQPYNPSILRMIKYVIDSCHKEGKFVAMCGEMAGDQIAVPLLIGMGLDEFSMSAKSMLKTRFMFRQLDSNKMTELVAQAINASTGEEVIQLVKTAVTLKV